HLTYAVRSTPPLLPILRLVLPTAPSSPDSYPLSLHDALPICAGPMRSRSLGTDSTASSRSSPSEHLAHPPAVLTFPQPPLLHRADRKSTRLNSSHVSISYAVFCLKKKSPTISNRAIVSLLDVR